MVQAETCSESELMVQDVQDTQFFYEFRELQSSVEVPKPVSFVLPIVKVATGLHTSY